MWTLTLPAVVCLTVVLQIVGLVTIVALRLVTSRRHQVNCHRLFFATLLALGVLTVLAVGVGDGAWMASGTSLSATTIAATLDFRGDHGRISSF